MLLRVAVIAIGMSIISSNVHALTWEELFQQKESLFEKYPQLEVIKRQCAAYKNGTAPSIAAEVIKHIPIVESHEELVDLKEMGNARITMMPNPATPFESDACNAGTPGASKMRRTVYEKLELMIAYLDELAEHFGYEPKRISIKIFQAYRPREVQEQLFNEKKAAIMAANPTMTDEQAEAETSKWVSPVKNNVPLHSTGAAVNIRLWDEQTQDFLDLGKFGAIWGENQAAVTFFENITDVQKSNRLYMVMAAAQAGLTHYVFGYWNFSDGDRHAAYWKKADPEKRIALYGSIE